MKRLGNLTGSCGKTKGDELKRQPTGATCYRPWVSSSSLDVFAQALDENGKSTLFLPKGLFFKLPLKSCVQILRILSVMLWFRFRLTEPVMFYSFRADYRSRLSICNVWMIEMRFKEFFNIILCVLQELNRLVSSCWVFSQSKFKIICQKSHNASKFQFTLG